MNGSDTRIILSHTQKTTIEDLKARFVSAMSSADICDESPLVQAGRNNTRDRPESNVHFTLGYYIVGHVCVISCVLLWIAFKDRYERTRIRPTVFIILAACASLAQMNFGSLQVIIGDAHPCWLAPTLMVMIVPFSSTTIIGRLLLFSFLSQFAQSASKAFNEDVKRREAAPDSRFSVAVSTGATSSGFGSSRSLILNRREKCVYWMRIVRVAAWKVLSPRNQITSREELFVLRFLGSPTGVFVIAMLNILPFVLVSLVLLSTHPVYLQCTNCNISVEIVIATIVIMVIQSTIGLTYWCILHRFKAEDPWGLKSECFYSLMFALLSFVGFILTGYSPDHIWPYSHQFMISLGIWLFVMEQSVVQLYLAWKHEKASSLRRSRGSKRNMFIGLVDESQQPSGVIATTTTDGRAAQSNGATVSYIDTLDTILRTKALSDAFEQQLIAEYGVESLFFIRDIDSWKRQYHDLKPATRLARAKRIYKAFIQSTGLYAVNIPYDMAQQIQEELFKKQRGKQQLGANSYSSSAVSVSVEAGSSSEDVPKMLFDEVYEEVRQLLATGAVRRFCHSENYRRIIEESDFGQITTTLGAPAQIPIVPPSPTSSTSRRLTSHHV